MLPRWAAPRVIAISWVIVALLGAGLAVAWKAPIPVFVSGPAMLVERPVESPAHEKELAWVAFLPAEDWSRLAPGQTLFVRRGETGERQRSTVIEVEPEPRSPMELARRFPGFPAKRPAAVVLASAELPPGEAGQMLGSIVDVDVRVGRRSALSLLLDKRATRRAAPEG